VVRDAESFVVADLAAEERLAGRVRSDRYSSNSLVVTPVAAGGPPFGVLCATDRADGSAFGAEDLALLRILALQVGKLLEAEFGGSGDLELARRVCDAMSNEVEPERLIAAALRAVAQTLPAAPVALHLMDGDDGALRIEGQFDGAGPAEREGLERHGGLTGLVLQTGHLVATDHPDKDPRFDPKIDTPADGAIRPLICVPVQLRGKTLGVLRAFPMSDASASARTAEVLSAAMSAAVRNVLLYRSLLESIDEVARVRRSHRAGR
jgi:GAF domain-containing protein